MPNLHGSSKRRTKPDVFVRAQEVLKRYPSLVYSYAANLTKVLNVQICAITIPSLCFVNVVAAAGTSIHLIPRDHAFCDQGRIGNKSIIIEDTKKSESFRNNPYVLDGPKIRFYVGVPIYAANGQRLATLCAADGQPNNFSDTAWGKMVATANAISNELCFDPDDDDELLQHLDRESLMGLLRTERPSNRDRIIAITQALQGRLDEWTGAPTAATARPISPLQATTGMVLPKTSRNPSFRGHAFRRSQG